MKLPQLESRERVVLLVGAIVALALVAWYVLMAEGSPWAKYQQSKRQVEQARDRLERITAMHEEIQRANADRAEIQRILSRRPANFSLWTVVNRAVQTVGLSQRATLSSLADNEVADATAVKLSLTGVSLQEIVDLLYSIHSQDSLTALYRVEHLRPTSSGKGLNGDLWLVAPRL